MEFTDVVRRRRMVRRYAEVPVEAWKVDRLLEHAVRAPSAGFAQGWAFLRLDAPADVDRFWRATTPEGAEGGAWLAGMRTAPVVIVPLSNKRIYLDRYAEHDKGWTDRDESRWPVPYWDIDTGMAALLILLTAVDEGLGACFFGIPPERIPAFRTVFGVPQDYTPIGAVTVGHRLPEDAGVAGSPARRHRRTVEEVVHRGSWGGSAPDAAAAASPTPPGPA